MSVTECVPARTAPTWHRNSTCSAVARSRSTILIFMLRYMLKVSRLRSAATCVPMKNGCRPPKSTTLRREPKCGTRSCVQPCGYDKTLALDARDDESSDDEGVVGDDDDGEASSMDGIYDERHARDAVGGGDRRKERREGARAEENTCSSSGRLPRQCLCLPALFALDPRHTSPKHSTIAGRSWVRPTARLAIKKIGLVSLGGVGG